MEIVPELTPTLWQCQLCAAVICIYSFEAIDEAVCPICCDVILDSRGSLETILGMSL